MAKPTTMTDAQAEGMGTYVQREASAEQLLEVVSCGVGSGLGRQHVGRCSKPPPAERVGREAKATLALTTKAVYVGFPESGGVEDFRFEQLSTVIAGARRMISSRFQVMLARAEADSDGSRGRCLFTGRLEALSIADAARAAGVPSVHR